MNFFTRCHDRWADMHPLWKGISVVALLAGLVLILGRPSLSLYRGWMVERQFASAVEASEKGDHAEARELALQVLRKDSARLDALPILLHATDALADPLRAEVARRVLIVPDPLPSDLRLAAWKIICRHTPSWQVTVSWAGMPAAEKTNEAFVLPLFDRMIFDGTTAAATDLLQAQPHPLSPELQPRLMSLVLDSDTAGGRRAFQESLIQRIAERRDGIELLLPLLDRLPQESLMPELHAVVVGWQQANDVVMDAAAELRLARCEMAAYPQRSGMILAETLERFRTEAPVATARWCVILECLDEALELTATFPPDDVEAFQLHCKILEEIGDLAAWAARLQSPPPDAFLPKVHSDRAHVATLMEQRPLRIQSEEAALATAAESRQDDALIRLARHAESRQQIDLARRAWVEAVRKRRGPLPLGTRLASVIEHLAMMNKESELLEMLTAYRFMEPTNFVFTVQNAYLSCITGRNSPASVIRELEIVRRNEPDLVPARCVLALAHLLEDRPEEALALTALDGKNWLDAKPAYRAIRAIALMQTGSEEEARLLLENLPWDEMLPSEVRTLRGLMDKAIR